ncbi:heart- and neural crest derivatives-expressed protein 1 [Anopheles bellator]|uniref:heart- and neural crest derivatives-expressed protein 1 n=1 Tax=Anopheles bellator TaxID=139047 RepID=UPI00264A166A|nr:heart- and neural crest derivatives-expressed protein 1 [Anopheles bellator]
MYNKMSSYESAASSEGDLCQPVCEPDPYYESSYYTQLYPADSQNPGTQVITIMDEEGYWGSPCSSTNESQHPEGVGTGHPPHHRERYSPTARSLVHSSAVSTIRLVSTSHLPQSCDPSTSSSSSSSSPSSCSVAPYRGGPQQHPIGGFECLRSPHGADGHHHNHHQHHHQQQQSPVYDCSMVYEKSANVYVPDEGYYGGNGTPMDVTSGGGGAPMAGISAAAGDHTATGHLHSVPSSSSSSLLSSSADVVPGTGPPVVRVVKRRNTANKKERRRTQSINSAYTSLRDRIPNVPNDTKLSKIKTLRLAISYIAHLIAVVNGNQDPSCDFRAELVPSSRKINAERRAQKSLLQNFSYSAANITEGRKIKGRTGWPQHVWALETKTSIK